MIDGAFFLQGVTFMRRNVICIVLILFSMTLISFAQAGEKLPPIPVKEYRLKNGLRVVTHVDRSTPVVAVQMWYHVGSKNESEGRTGFAHLFEHMMFQGSKSFDNDYFTPLREAGGTINGTTNVDRTYYYETVPSNFLELALFLEADRLGGLLEAMTQEKLDNQRDVVKNERRQRVDNQPYGNAFEKITQIMFPEGHPYHWTTIGSMEDLQAASLDDVKTFFRQYYIPNNAVLVLSGDVDEKKAKQWVEKYFGPLKNGEAIKRPDPKMPKLDEVIRTTVEDPLARLPRRYMVWHTVPAYAADEAALDILSNILSSGRGSRLQSQLIYGKQSTQQISAFNSTNEIAGTFQITATARPGRSLDEIEADINTEIERIKKEAPAADEITRAKNVIEAGTIFGLQTVLSKGRQISGYAGYLGKPDYFQADLDRYANVTAADIQRVANKYLIADRLVMTYNPAKAAAPRAAGAADQPTSVKSDKKDQKKIDEQTARLPKPGAQPKFALPAIEKTKLSNGLEIWMMPQNELPIVSMNLVLKTGTSNEPADLTGVASMTASLIDYGTKDRSAIEIANQLQSIGASLGASSGWDSTSVSMQTLTRNLDQALDIYADVITGPTFPDDEVKTFRDRSIVALQQRKANANMIANIAYNKVLYGDHPYGRDDNEQTIRAITRDALVEYYNNTFRPNNGVLIVVGNYNKASLTEKLEKAFGSWKSGDVEVRALPPTAPLEKTGIYLVDRPNSTQSVVSIGQVGLDRTNRDYFPVVVMNTILGSGITSRISMNLREDKGYTYGAGSSFAFRRGAGPFRAGGDMQTAVTKESVQELLKEINGIRGDIPVTQRELDYNKQSIIRRYPSGFETIGAISDQLENLVIYGLPDTYFNDYVSRINAVSLEDVNRVAKKYLDPSKIAIVIVGDRKVIEPGLKDLGYPLTMLDIDGKPIAD